MKLRPWGWIDREVSKLVGLETGYEVVGSYTGEPDDDHCEFSGSPEAGSWISRVLRRGLAFLTSRSSGGGSFL